MKHPDDQINERLQKALLARFKNIHDQPDPALSKIILGSINRKHRSVKPLQWGLTALFVLLVSIAVNDQKLPKRSLAVIDRPVEIVTDKTQLITNKTHSMQANRELKSHIGELVKDRILSKSETAKEVAIPALESDEMHSFNAISYRTFKNNEPTEDMNLLDNIPFKQNNSMQLPDINQVSNENIPSQSKNPWHFVLGFTPMNTFQVVRISSQQQARYQNFSFPANLTRKKIAYKFHLGVEKNGFQLLLNYSLMKQTFDYEVATGEFLLDKNGNPVRKGIPKALQTDLHFVGAGLRKNFTLARIGLKNYFVSTGFDFSRELASKQNAFWATASLGKEIQLNKNTSLMAGPYLEYSLNKFATSDVGFQIQPYQVGFSFNLKYKIN